jgi:uncharacterized membrane protein YidH (DUF202 family)
MGWSLDDQGKSVGVSVVLVIVGIGCLLVGTHNVIRRNAIVARRRRLNLEKLSIQPPMAYAVSGGLLVILGTVWILVALV